MAASRLCHFLSGFLVFGLVLHQVTCIPRRLEDYGGGVGQSMEETEVLGLFELMDGLLDDPDWAEVHPQPCTDTPWPGVQCELGDEVKDPIFHVTKIHIGPDIIIHPCKTNPALPNSLHKLPYLKTLSIFSCFVTSTPISLSPTLFKGLSFLEHIALNSNPSLSGQIPSNLGTIPTLKVLTLSQNNLQGRIPVGFGGLLPNLEQLDLSYNNLTGEIPQELGGLKSLTILDLSSNSLEGVLPSSLGQLEFLQKIDLGSNRFHGTIPPDLGQLKRLVLLDLSHNFINGPIPETLSGLEQLQYLIADHNPIDSEIPQFLAKLGRLTSISLSGCDLRGPIPSFLSSLKNLTAISLQNNTLSGTIPSTLGSSLPNLDQLNLSYNQLSGELGFPEEFIRKLGKRLDVEGNAGLCTTTNRENNSNAASLCSGLNNTSCTDEDKNHPDESKGMETKWDHDGGGHDVSSSDLEAVQLQKLFLCTFVLSLLSFLV